MSILQRFARMIHMQKWYICNFWHQGVFFNEDDEPETIIFYKKILLASTPLKSTFGVLKYRFTIYVSFLRYVSFLQTERSNVSFQYFMYRSCKPIPNDIYNRFARMIHMCMWIILANRGYKWSKRPKKGVKRCVSLRGTMNRRKIQCAIIFYGGHKR